MTHIITSMQDWNLNYEVSRAVLSLIGSVITLGVASLLGGWVASFWNFRQKRREIQLSALEQFYLAYGAFFTVWKLWNALVGTAELTPERRWDLHSRAASAEAIVESTFVKLSVEIRLTCDDIKTLGCFRQAFQQLRESIRDGKKLLWVSSENPEYKSFKRLSTQVSALLAGKWNGPCPPKRAEAQLLEITSNKFEQNWAAAAEQQER